MKLPRLIVRRSAVLLPILAVVGIGCGGTPGGSLGGSTTGGSTQETVSISADHTTVTPGQTVNLTWSSQNASNVVTSNIAAGTVNGTLAVSPTFSSDYGITVNGSGGNKSATVHVTVTRPTPRFIIVGSSAHPDVPQIQSVLSKLGAVTVQPTMPTVPSSYDAVVIHASGTVSPADAPTVTAALAAGKGVVLLGLSPSELATGTAAFSTNSSDATFRKLDTTAISAWFGGVTELDKGVSGVQGYYQSVVDLPYFALPASLDFTQNVYGNTSGDDATLGYAPSGLVGVTCYKTIAGGNTGQAIGFAFKVPTGGRLYWQWHFDGFIANDQTIVSGIFDNACLWAASN